MSAHWPLWCWHGVHGQRLPNCACGSHRSIVLQCLHARDVLASVSPAAACCSTAERFKGNVSRIALVQCCSGKRLHSGMEAAVNEYGITAMLAMVAADEQFLQFTW